MQRLRLFGLALLAIFAVGAITSATSFAEEAGNPKMLCLGTEGKCTFPITFTGKSEKGELITELGSVKCTEEGSNSGEITGVRTATANIDFHGCTLSTNKEKCSTTGDAAGTILLSAVPVKLVAYKSGTALLAGLLFSPTEVLMTCGTVKVKIKGTVIALVALESPITSEESKNLKVLFDHAGNKQTPEECELPKETCEKEGKKVKFFLEGNLGVGFEHAALAETKTLLVLATDVKLDF
jgi:hypothetical protein